MCNFRGPTPNFPKFLHTSEPRNATFDDLTGFTPPPIKKAKISRESYTPVKGIGSFYLKEMVSTGKWNHLLPSHFSWSQLHLRFSILYLQVALKY